MKTLLKWYYCVVMVAAVIGFNSCDSATSPQTLTCGNPNLHLQKISFVLDGKLYDFDSLPGFVYSIERKFDNWTGPGITITYSLFGDSPEHTLTVRLPAYKTGIYEWNDRSIDSNAFGFQFDIDSSSTESYRSISGSTNVVVYDSPINELDSLFSTFCGKVRDDAGTILDITDGSFYFIDIR